MAMAATLDAPIVPDVNEIVMPIDFSAHGWRILPLAQSLAKLLGAELRLLHVDTASPWRAEDEQRMTLTSTPYGGHVEVEVIADADAARGIDRYLTRHPRAVVALTARTRGPAGQGPLGAVFDTVLGRSQGPVVAVGPEFDANVNLSVSRIVACVEAEDDAAVTVPDAAGWALQLGVPLDVLSVIGGEPASREARDVVVDAAVKSVAPTHSLVSGMILVGRHPAEEIVSYAAAAPGTLIALATHARPMAERTGTGSVALHVLRHAKSAVWLRRRP